MRASSQSTVSQRMFKQRDGDVLLIGGDVSNALPICTLANRGLNCVAHLHRFDVHTQTLFLAQRTCRADRHARLFRKG